MWIWKTWEGRQYLTCGLLSKPHGFFTAHFYGMSPAELSQVFSSDAMAWHTKQVHGDVLATPQREGAGELPADGSVSSAVGQSLWVRTADCTPALIEDVRTGQVAAVHAGWRSTAKQIVPKAVQRLLDAGSRLPDLRVALGPAIDGAVYQVGEDVALEVVRTVKPHLETLDEALTELHDLVGADVQPGHARLHVSRVNQAQLLAMGLAEQQVSLAPFCTYQQPDDFFSFRRTGEKKNQWAGIVS